MINKRAEQIEQARRLIETGISEDLVEVLEKQYPELIESEDEKMRKHIIEIIKDNAKSKCIPCDAEIAYLEKQKDASKAIEAVERIDKYIDEHTANAHDMKDSNPDKKYYSGVDDTLSNIVGILSGVYSEEKQKEQKPAEWSEEDEEHINSIFSDFKQSVIPDEEDQKWLKNRLKSIRPQSKQEWTIKDAKPGDILTTDTVTFIFKSVDKNGSVSMYCSYAVSTTGTHLNFSDTVTVDSEYVHPASIEQRREFLEELLKYISSQHHWKPSEEQIEALECAERWYSDNMGCDPCLYQLLCDLKSYRYEN